MAKTGGPVLVYPDQYIIKKNIVRILLRHANLQFRPLQNSEHLHMHYTVRRFANYGNEGAACSFF